VGASRDSTNGDAVSAAEDEEEEDEDEGGAGSDDAPGDEPKAAAMALLDATSKFGGRTARRDGGEKRRVCGWLKRPK
jgi:hypothetical protein